jgi:ABC-type lipopolysaccharide export system ATPase subunit
VHRALEISDRAYVLVTGHVAFHGRAAAIASDERIRSAYLGAREPLPSMEAPIKQGEGR